MDWNEPHLFPSFGWSRGLNPRDLSLALHQFADLTLKGQDDLPQCLALTSRGAFESRQISNARPHSTARGRGNVDKAIEDWNFGRLYVVANVRVDILSGCDVR